MAHNLETINGKIAMAYRGETPWHGLGTKVDEFTDVDHMLKAASLDWTVAKEVVTHRNRPVKNKFALVRDVDGEVLDFVGNRYVPHQNRDVLQFFTKFAEQGDVTLDTAGALNDGRYVWGLAKLKNNFTLAGGDEVKGHLLIAIPHMMGYATQVRFTATRVVCENTLSMALGAGAAQFKMSHLNVFDETVYSVAEQALGISEEKMTAFQRQAEVLAGIKIGADDTIRLLAKIFQPNDPVQDILNGKVKTGRKLTAVLEAIDGSPGSDLETARGTAWGVLQGLTYLDSHVSGRDSDSRMMSTWFGQNQVTTDKVLQSLLELAD